MKVAALQWDVRRGEVDANLAAASEGLGRAAQQGVELLLLPELWSTSFPDAADAVPELVARARAASATLAALGARLGVDWAGSALDRDEAQPCASMTDRPVNRLELFSHGQRVFAYDKLHLFGPTAEDRVFRAGNALPPTLRWRGLLLSGVVCYDLRFPELTRKPFLAGAQLLLVPAQWPRERAVQWRALVHGLAASNQCFVIACNRLGREQVARRGLELDFPGNSLIVGPAGETLAEGRGESGLVLADIRTQDAGDWQQRVPVRRDLRPDVYGD